MASILADWSLDNGLYNVHALATDIYIVSQDPATFTAATVTYALGHYTFGAGNVFGVPSAGSPNGRQIASAPVSAGSVTGTATATAWAVVDATNLRLLANGQLTTPISVTNGGSFSLGSFTISIPNQ